MLTFFRTGTLAFKFVESLPCKVFLNGTDYVVLDHFPAFDNIFQFHFEVIQCTKIAGDQFSGQKLATFERVAERSFCVYLLGKSQFFMRNTQP